MGRKPKQPETLPLDSVPAQFEGLTLRPGVQATLKQSVARQAASEFSASIKRAAPGRSYSDLLSRLYTQADELVDEIARSDEGPAKKAEALKSVGKLLPLLQQAEKNARTSIKRKAIEEMSDAELQAAVLALSPAQTSISPTAVEPTPLVPPPAQKEKIEIDQSAAIINGVNDVGEGGEE